jgi:hypothetical protein
MEGITLQFIQVRLLLHLTAPMTRRMDVLTNGFLATVAPPSGVITTAMYGLALHRVSHVAFVLLYYTHSNLCVPQPCRAGSCSVGCWRSC